METVNKKQKNLTWPTWNWEEFGRCFPVKGEVIFTLSCTWGQPYMTSFGLCREAALQFWPRKGRILGNWQSRMRLTTRILSCKMSCSRPPIMASPPQWTEKYEADIAAVKAPFYPQSSVSPSGEHQWPRQKQTLESSGQWLSEALTRLCKYSRKEASKSRV